MPTRNRYHPCPWCGVVPDGRTAALTGIKANPVTGDVSICLSCSRPARYTAGGELRAFSTLDVLDLDVEGTRLVLLAVIGAMTVNQLLRKD